MPFAQTRAAIAAMGTTLTPDLLGRVRALYDAEQAALVQAVPAAATDLAYGPHERHRLDLYGAGKGFDGLIVPLQLIQRHTQIVVGDAQRRIEGDRLLLHSDGVVAFALRVKQHAHVVVQQGVAWIHLHRLAI